jgi:hypothetical protein
VLVYLFYIIIRASLIANMNPKDATEKNVSKSGKIMPSIGSLAIHVFNIGVYLVLFNLGICNLMITILLTVIYIIPNLYSEKVFKILNTNQVKWSQLIISIFIATTSVYALYSIQYFKENQFIRYLYLFLFAITFVTNVKKIKSYTTYMDSCANKSEVTPLLLSNLRLNGNIFPVEFILNLWIVDLLSIIPFLLRIGKNPINYGDIDSRNRENNISFNSDRVSQLLQFAVGSTILLVDGFNSQSLFIFTGVMAIWPYLRRSPSKLSKYFTVVVGEIRHNRPPMYDNLLMRVMPGIEKSILNIAYVNKKDYSYSIFFDNIPKIWDKKRGIIQVKEYVKSCSHLVILFRESEASVNYVGEYNLLYALTRPDVIIDIWMWGVKVDMLHGEINGDDKWLRLRLNIVRKIGDEDYGEIDTVVSKYEEGSYNRQMADSFLVRQNILNSSSFESLRQNIQLFEHQYTSTDHERIKQLTGRGIYELNTLYRQLHESPSIPSRFIDLLNIAECMMRYLVGFLHAERIVDGEFIHGNMQLDTNAIAFGSCTNFLARWKKSCATSETILGERISSLLDVVYDDAENVEALIKYIRMMNQGVTTKYSRKPTLLELSMWLVTVRNKTRGHGTPSKVDYGFYVCLEKAVLFMLAECAKIEINPCYIADVDGQKWTFYLASGGYPEHVPIVDQLRKGVHFNPLLENERIEELITNHRRILDNISEGDESLYLYVTDGEKFEWWRCCEHFKVKDAIVHLLNERNDKKESWISFSTGRILRPEISEL